MELLAQATVQETGVRVQLDTLAGNIGHWEQGRAWLNRVDTRQTSGVPESQLDGEELQSARTHLEALVRSVGKDALAGVAHTGQSANPLQLVFDAITTPPLDSDGAIDIPARHRQLKRLALDTYPRCVPAHTLDPDLDLAGMT